MPSRFVSLNPSVAWCRSLYANLCGPNVASQSSLTSAYMRRRRRSANTTAPTANTSAADAIGSTISSVLERGFGVFGEGGGVERRGGGAVHVEAPTEHVVAAEEDAGRRREADVGGVAVDDGGEVDGGGEEWLVGATGHLDGRHGDIDLHGLAVEVDPHLHRLAAHKAHVRERAGGVVGVVAGVVGDDGVEAVDVDPDVVAAHVVELGVEDGVELDGEEVVGGVAVVHH
nr:unnamed protein product [Digitaria exilis]